MPTQQAKRKTEPTSTGPSSPAEWVRAHDFDAAKSVQWSRLRAGTPTLPATPSTPEQHALLLRTLAGSLADDFEYDHADTVLEEALDLCPTEVETHALKVHLKTQASQLTDAEAAARAALDLRPDTVLSHKLLIDVLSQQGRNDDAAAQADALTATLPRDAHAHLIKADTLARFGRDSDARDAYAKVADLAPGARAQVLVRMGDMAFNAGDDAQAEQDFTASLQINSANTKAAYGLINTFYSQGHADKGDRLAKQAYEKLEGFGAAYLDSWFPLKAELQPKTGPLDKKHAVLVNGLGELPGLPLGMSLIKGYVESNSDYAVTNLDLAACYFRDLFAAMQDGSASVSFDEQDRLFNAIDIFKPGNDAFFDEKSYRKLAPYFFKYASMFAERPRSLCAQAIDGLAPVPWFVRAYAEHIVAAKPFCVGLSVTFTEQHYFSILLAKEIKRLSPETITVFGGGFFNAKNVEPFLSKHWIDYLVLHDGEAAFLDLLKALNGDGDIKKVPNIAFFDTKTQMVFHNDEGAGVKPNDLAFADYSDYDFADYFMPAPVIPMLSSRGCYWRRCTFCDHFASYAGTYKTQSIERFVDEIEHNINAFGVRHFSFVDEMISAARFYKISEEILARGLDISFYALAKPTNDFDAETLALMHKAGCRVIYWGVEAGSDRVLELMDKGNDVAGTSRTLHYAHTAGIRNHLFMIIGYPSETVEELHETVQFLFDNRNVIEKIIPSPFIMKMGTPVCDKYWEYGVTRAKKMRSLCNHNGIDYVVDGSITQADAHRYFDRLLYGFFDAFTSRGVHFGVIRDQVIVCYAGDDWEADGPSGEKAVPAPKKVFKLMEKAQGHKRMASDETDDKVFPRWPRAE